MSKAPKCKLCGAAHWLSEPHVFKEAMQQVAPIESRGTSVQGRELVLPETPPASSPDVSRDGGLWRETSRRVFVKHHCRWCPDEPLGFRSQLWDWEA